jgi:serine/threonine-protein kinase
VSSCAQCRAPIPAGARNCPRCGITLSGAEFETLPGAGAHAGAQQSDGMIGRWVLDQYVVRSKLGEGGMGAVYVAEQPAIGRLAVIKVIHPWLSRDPAVSARFATEAKAAARLQNPHIVAIYNYGRMPDGTLFLAMEHLQGLTLASLLRKEGRLDPSRAVAIATQCCEALAHAHRRNVVHRDLKPSNIMLVVRDRGPEFVKVLDFGIAKLDGGEGTAAGVMLGTPQYMSPEQLAGKPIDGRSDIYALGVLLYEMLAGRPPFVADAAVAYVHKHTNEHPPPLSQTAPGVRVPPALEACIMRALAKGPHQRPQTAEMLADELWQALMATVDSSHVPTPNVRPARPARAAVALAVAGGIGLLGAFTATGYWLLHSSAPPPAEPQPVAAIAPPGPAPAPAPAPVPPPHAVSPEKQTLMAKSIPELEAEFQRATILSGLPRESIELALQEYRKAAADPPPGFDATTYRKALLADLVLAWRAHRAEIAPPDRSLDELEAVFLTMSSSYDVAERSAMLNHLKEAAADEPNADAAVRARLLEWIAIYGDSEDPIEILEDDDE